MLKNKKRNSLTLANNPKKLDFWDEGWSRPPSFRGHLPTLQGWSAWSRQPSDPNGIKVRSKEAISRWRDDNWSSAITFYEDYNMAFKTRQGKKEYRVISPTEAERLLGFPDNWTKPLDVGEFKGKLDSQKV